MVERLCYFATTITTKSNCEYINFRVGLVTIGDTCTFSDFMFLEGEHTWTVFVIIFHM